MSLFPVQSLPPVWFPLFVSLLWMRIIRTIFLYVRQVKLWSYLKALLVWMKLSIKKKNKKTQVKDVSFIGRKTWPYHFSEFPLDTSINIVMQIFFFTKFPVDNLITSLSNWKWSWVVHLCQYFWLRCSYSFCFVFICLKLSVAFQHTCFPLSLMIQ